MTFPIVVGTGPRHSSCRPFPQSPRGRIPEDEGGGEEGDCENGVVLAVGTNSDETLAATVFISYHFFSVSDCAGKTAEQKDDDNGEVRGCESDETRHLPREENEHATAKESRGTRDETHYHVVAELRVQINPPAAPFASNADATARRETKSRVPLGVLRRRGPTRRPGATPHAPAASVEFSSNDQHVACLVPLPSGYEWVASLPELLVSRGTTPISALVIFRIQAQKLAAQPPSPHQFPTFPKYVTERDPASGDGTKDEARRENLPTAEHIECADSSETLQHASSASSHAPSSRSASSYVYVAREPKIVRGPPLPDGAGVKRAKEPAPPPQRSFFRSLSGGSGGAGPVPPAPSVQGATCMCAAPSDRSRGEGTSVLLVATADGALLLVDFALARAVRSVTLVSPSPCRVNGHVRNPIVHMAQCAPTVCALFLCTASSASSLTSLTPPVSTSLGHFFRSAVETVGHLRGRAGLGVERTPCPRSQGWERACVFHFVRGVVRIIW